MNADPAAAPRTRDAAAGRTLLFVVLALVGFSSNSLLCRAALAGHGRRIDPASFTSVRLVSGAVVLALLVFLRAPLVAPNGEAPRGRASLTSALVLFGYAICFSLAYVRIHAGAGALILFGFVQTTMIGWGLLRGERVRVREALGLCLAIGGLAVLTAPGATAPDPLGAASMALAGVAWGVYSLRGRSSTDPLGATAANFARSVPMTLAASLVLAVLERPHYTRAGVALAVASGALASGVGYSLWYAALPALTALRAAVIQLCVPVVTTFASIALLGEQASLRAAGAAALVLGGVLIAIVRPRSRA